MPTLKAIVSRQEIQAALLFVSADESGGAGSGYGGQHSCGTALLRTGNADECGGTGKLPAGIYRHRNNQESRLVAAPELYELALEIMEAGRIPHSKMLAISPETVKRAKQALSKANLQAK